QGMRLAHPARILYFGICERPKQEAENQDAVEDYSQSGAEVQAFCIRRSALGTERWQSGAGCGGAAAAVQPASALSERLKSRSTTRSPHYRKRRLPTEFAEEAIFEQNAANVLSV